ncbi:MULTISPECIES: hypothetical protein [Clostridium]|uniref:Uncharacterized protein n=1 Tax=Clostridium cibarium TaxID=2762247 RepID=A0ABR8PXC3_9CLOT|nr:MULTISPECIES: hypothetical protein [Clostridium]MBD7912798.1 hypothetical protein [Clostridium cibarium]
MSIDDEIKSTIINEVFQLFSQEKFQEGRILLHRMYLKYYNKITILHTKRILIHNLAWVEDELGEVDSAKIHIKMIRDEIENDIDYIYSNMLDYCLILNLYCEIFKDEISIDEYKEINIFIANYHHESGSIGREYISLTNVYKVDKRWDDILSLIKTLVEFNENEYFINEILEELAKNDMEAFNKGKKLLNGGEGNV